MVSPDDPWLTPCFTERRQVNIGCSASAGMVSPVTSWLTPCFTVRRQVRIGCSAMAPDEEVEEASGTDFNIKAYLGSPGAVKAWRFHRPLASRVAEAARNAAVSSGVRSSTRSPLLMRLAAPGGACQP